MEKALIFLLFMGNVTAQEKEESRTKRDVNFSSWQNILKEEDEEADRVINENIKEEEQT